MNDWTKPRCGPGSEGATADGSARLMPSDDYDTRHRHAQRLAAEALEKKDSPPQYVDPDKRT